MKKSIVLGLLTIILFSSVHAGTSGLTFTPLTKTTFSLSDNNTEIVQYLVTNQAKKNIVGKMQPIQGVSQVTTSGNCPSLFKLAYKQSCTLTLSISGSNIPHKITGGPVVCQKKHHLKCYQPEKTDRLNITKINSPSSYTIGGSITGLIDNGLILLNNADETDPLSPASGATSFVFSKQVAYGGNYNVVINYQPPSITCSISNGTGIVTGNITSISIHCNAATFAVEGSISGLTNNGLVLLNNGDVLHPLSLESGATSFTFPEPVPYGGGYNVTVNAQPPGLVCTVSNGTGSNVTSDINSVSVSCNIQNYTVGGTISGLSTNGLVLRNNGSDDLIIPSEATAFQFPTPVSSDSNYSVTIAAQPANAYCYVANGSGSNVLANVTDVQISCLNIGDAYGGGVIYQINGTTANVVTLADLVTTQWTTTFTQPFVNQDDGYVNTYKVLNDAIYTAAAACRNYNAGQDWFLPATNQWGVLGNTSILTALNAKSTTTGFIPFVGGTTYWSSSAYTYNPLWGYAMTQVFSSSTNSSSFNYLKSLTLPVRCIRVLSF